MFRVFLTRSYIVLLPILDCSVCGVRLWVGLTKKIRLGPGKPLRVIHPAHPDSGKSPPGLGGGFEMFEIYKDGTVKMQY